MKWAVRIRYVGLHSRKWRRHTTKWYDDPNKAWEESDKFQIDNKDIVESSSSLIHKEK